MTNIMDYVEDDQRHLHGLSAYLVYDDINDKEAISPGEGDDVDNMIRDYITGYPAKYLQAAYHMSAGQMFSHIRARKVPLRYTGKTESTLDKRMSHLTYEQKTQVILDYIKGIPNHQIYKKYQIHKNGLYTLLDANRVIRKRRGES